LADLQSIYRPVQFFSLDFVLTWCPLWLAVIGISYGWLSFNWFFMLVAAISATAAALFMIYSSRNPALINDYWNRVLNVKRISRTMWPFILLFMLAVNLVAMAVSLLFDGSVTQLHFSPDFLTNPLMFTLLLFLYGPLPEELGWRGYGIDSLRSRFNLLTSSLMLAAIWAIWHIPFFFLQGSYQNDLLSYPLGVGAFLVALLPAEIITDWLFYKNNRSTLAAILFHFSINFSGELLQFDRITKDIQAFLLLVISIAIVVKDREMFLKRKFTIDWAAS
jgi:hypothetical protein